MSWILVTLAVVAACFFGAFALCEWLIGRRRAGRNDERDSVR